MRHTTTDLERRITDTGGGAMALQRWWLPAMLVGVSIQLSTPLLRQNNCTLSGWNMRFLSVCDSQVDPLLIDL